MAASPTVVPAMAAPIPSRLSGDGGRPAGEREVFLDVVRALAIIRVIAWHAFGLAAITYFVAAIPAMFFVTGSLLAKSMRRREARAVLTDRFRRLLIPLWAFGLMAWLAMAVAAWWAGTDLPLHRALTWIFPLTDPQGTAWEGGWLTSHLWYLRTVTWLFLLAPLLLWAVRVRPALTLSAVVLAVVGLDLLARGQTTVPGGHRTLWIAGDLALYAVFLLFGFLHRDGRFGAVTRRGWLVLAGLAGIGAVAWRLTQPVPLGVVNNSHPLHLFVGMGWLALALAAQGPLARLGASRLLGPPVRAIGKRALTIYLWHTAAVIVAINVLEARGIDEPFAYNVGLVLLTAIGIVVAVQLFGWIEDIAARRVPHHSRRSFGALSRPVLAAATGVAVAAVVLFPADQRFKGKPEASAAVQRARRPPIPSRPPPPPIFAAEEAAAPEPQTEPITAETEGRFVAGLDGVLEQWAWETGVGGAIVGVAGPNLRWTGATGTRPGTGEAVRATDRIDLASLTKLFTSALVYHSVDAGLIDISSPLPTLAVLPEFPYEAGITVQHLLEHTAGLRSYLDTTQYAYDPEAIDDPVSAVRASLDDGLLAEPGTTYSYSSTNYLVLGLLLEEVTGQSFSELLRETYFAPLGLRDTIHRAPEPGWPRGGTAGIETTMPDLLTAGLGILRDHVGVSTDAHQQMTSVDYQSGFGAGTFGFCPCRFDDNGEPQFFAIGYYGATTVLGYAASPDLVVAVDLVDSLGLNGGYDAVASLFEKIDELARSS